MKCKCCGKEIHDKAVICVSCGDITGVRPMVAVDSPDTRKLGTLGAVFGVFLPPFGVVLSLVRLTKGRTVSGTKCLLLSSFMGTAMVITAGLLGAFR